MLEGDPGNVILDPRGVIDTTLDRYSNSVGILSSARTEYDVALIETTDQLSSLLINNVIVVSGILDKEIVGGPDGNQAVPSDKLFNKRRVIALEVQMLNHDEDTEPEPYIWSRPTNGDDLAGFWLNRVEWQLTDEATEQISRMLARRLANR